MAASVSLMVTLGRLGFGLARERLAMPIVATGMLAVLAVSALFELSPASSAITSLARGRWFPEEEPLRQIAPSLTAAALVIMLAVATGIRKNR